MGKVAVELRVKQKDVWPATVSVDRLLEGGWQPLPFDQFVLKVHSRCNLACDYCYMYELQDSTWKDQPGSMSEDVASALATRVAEHARQHGLPAVQMILHGGEPLLVGHQRLELLLNIFANATKGIARVVFHMQTNGTLLTDRVAELLARFDVMVGFSLDGDRRANDRHRKRANGTGTYDIVSNRIETLRSGPHSRLFAGICATVDLQNDPVETYLSLRQFAPPTMDFLLPHANWQSPPPRHSSAPDDTSYADWLIPIFDQWFFSERDEPRIRIFDALIRLIYGQPTIFENVGIAPITLATIQTDGTYELVDAVRSAYDGAARTGLNVYDNPLDDLLMTPGIAVRQLGAQSRHPTCQACPELDVCGAGYFPHRYHAQDGFLQRTVYCADLAALIAHIRKRLVHCS